MMNYIFKENRRLIANLNIEKCRYKNEDLQ